LDRVDLDFGCFVQRGVPRQVSVPQSAFEGGGAAGKMMRMSSLSLFLSVAVFNFFDLLGVPDMYPSVFKE
jgi:hypothetical protein